jgi:hypothetical protein
MNGVAAASKYPVEMKEVRHEARVDRRRVRDLSLLAVVAVG